LTDTRDSLGPEAASYGLGAVVRLTGLSPHVLRAWERRYGVVRPRRTPGGTRRYSERDVARLRLLAAALAQGHRIGALAELSDEAIEELLAPGRDEAPAADSLGALVAAAERLDLPELEQRMGLQLAARGAFGFARDVVAPLLRELGTRWEHGRTSVASEHLASSVARTLLGGVLRLSPRAPAAPHLIFATPEGERHELGTLMAAVVAGAAGAQVTFLGPDLPVSDLLDAAGKLKPAALVIGAVGLPAGELSRYLAEVRAGLPRRVEVWVGGCAVPDDVPGLRRVPDLETLASLVSQRSRIPGPGEV
jgi:MerR family transcriptional regulator, light-induced transcriptional regulator